MEASTGTARAVRLDLGSKLVIIMGGVLAALALTAINSVLPQIDDALAHSARDSMLVKQLIGGVGLAMVFGSVLSGFLVDRFGLRPVILVAAVVYVIAGTAGLYLGTLNLLLGSRLVLGLTAACIQVSSLALINRRLAGAQRAKWMGIHISVAMFGTIFVHPLAGHLGELNWRFPFALYGLGAVLVLGMVLSHPEPEERKPVVVALAAGPRLTFRERLQAVRWFPFHYIPFAFLVGSIVFLPNIYLPFILRQYGATPSLIAYVLTAESITGSIVAICYGPARRVLSYHATFMVSFAFAATGTLLAAAATSLVGVVGGMLVFGLGTGWLMANIMTALGGKVSTERQGRAAGFVKAAHFLSGPLAILLIEPIARKGGPISALLVVACVAGLLFMLIGLRLWSGRSSERPVRA